MSGSISAQVKGIKGGSIGALFEARCQLLRQITQASAGPEGGYYWGLRACRLLSKDEQTWLLASINLVGSRGRMAPHFLAVPSKASALGCRWFSLRTSAQVWVASN